MFIFGVFFIPFVEALQFKEALTSLPPTRRDDSGLSAQIMSSPLHALFTLCDEEVRDSEFACAEVVLDSGAV